MWMPRKRPPATAATAPAACRIGVDSQSVAAPVCHLLGAPPATTRWGAFV